LLNRFSSIELANERVVFLNKSKRLAMAIKLTFNIVFSSIKINELISLVKKEILKNQTCTLTAGDQLLSLNREDFERAGTGRKAGYKFTIEFTEGKVSNVISGSDLASHLAAAMLEDSATKIVLLTGHFQVILNTKFQITVKNITPQSVASISDVEVGKD
jgi:hypothetical protein